MTLEPHIERLCNQLAGLSAKKTGYDKELYMAGCLRLIATQCEVQNISAEPYFKHYRFVYEEESSDIMKGGEKDNGR